MANYLSSFTDVLMDTDEIPNSQPISLSSPNLSGEYLATDSNKIFNYNDSEAAVAITPHTIKVRPVPRTGQKGDFRSFEEIDNKYRGVFTYQYFNLVQSQVIDDALYSDKSMVVCAPTGSGKTVVFEMAVVQLLMELEDKGYTDDFKIIYMAPVKSLCNERLTEWYSKFTKLGMLCIEVTGDTDVDFSQLKPYRVIITTPEKWDMLTRRWRDHRSLVEVIKLFLIDEVHILNDEIRGPVLEAVVSRMKTIESSSQSAHRIESLQQQYTENATTKILGPPPRIRFVAVSATVNNPEDVAAWLGNGERPAVFYKFGDECRPVKLKRVVEGYPCPDGTSIFKFDIILNYKLWPIIQKYHNGKPTLIFCNTRKSVALTADALSRELTVTFTQEQKARLTALASAIKNRKLQQLVLSGVGCHHAGLLYEERLNIEQAFRNMDLPILITTTTLAMGVNLPAHLVIVKNTQQYVNGAYQEYSMSTVLQMVGRAGRPQFDTEATAVIMTRLADKPRYQALVGGCEPLQSYLHRRLAENLNSEAALGTVCDVAQCVQWLRSTFLYARAIKDPKWYLGLPREAPKDLITKKIEELCVKAMNGLATAGLITMDDASCIESTQAGRLMSLYYLDLETMKVIMKIEGTESLERLLILLCECHELSDVHLRMDEKRCLNALNRNNAAATIRYPMKGKIASRQMKVNCMIQAILGCLPIPDPALNQEAMKIMRIADRVCKCLVAYVTRSELVSKQPQIHSAVLNSLILAKCVVAHLWENSPYVSKQLKGIGPTFSTLLATAGKVNFLLLEESHPRDLERIMNKGAPAGNVLRKQIGLLPKYQVTATPLDERRVSVRLDLLNMAHLMENMEHLTAGETHKSYVVVGDSENYLLLLTSFVDKDLMGVYEGSMTYEITRKHNFEHKVIIHCLSSKFVGIDAQTEYIFKDLGQPFIRGEVTNPQIKDTATKTTTKKQTTITDVFKERKRKNTDDISQSKEKMKRESTLIDKFKWLRDSFGAASKEIKESVAQSTVTSNTLLQDLIKDKSSNDTTNTQTPHQMNYAIAEKDSEIAKIHEYVDLSYDNINEMAKEEPFIIDERIDRILNDIENEISMNSNGSGPKADMSVFDTDISKGITKGQLVRDVTAEIDDKYKSRTSNKTVNCTSNSRVNDTRKRKLARSNFSCVDKLEKQDSKTDAKDTVTFDDNKNWINTIREQIKKFINNAPTSNNIDSVVTNLVDNAQSQEIETTKGIMQIDNGNIHPSTQYINEINPFTNMGNEAVLKNIDEKELSLLNVNLLEHKISNPNELASIKQCTITSQKLEVNTSILKEHKTPDRDCRVPKAYSGIDMEITNLSETDNNYHRPEGPNFNYPVQSNKNNFNRCDYNSIQTKIPDCDCTLSKANSDIDIKINNSNKTDNNGKVIETPTYEVPKLAVMILSGLDKENAASDKLESNNEHYNYKNMIDLFDSNKARALCSTQTFGNKTNDTDPSCNNPQRSKYNNVINSPLTDNPKLSKLNCLTHSTKIVPYKPSFSNYPLEFDSSPISKETLNTCDNYLDRKVDNIPTENIDNTPKELVTRSEHCVISSNSKYRHRPNEGFGINNNGDICNTPKERVKCTEYFVTSSNPKYYNRPNDRFNDNDNNNADRSKYINKYHFSTSQIGVSTKTLPEHDLKIIRKVDIDVNVTEIITKRKNIYLNNEEKEHTKSTLDIDTNNTKKLNARYQPIPDIKTEDGLHTYKELKNVMIETNQANIPKLNKNMDTTLIQEVRTHNLTEAKADDDNERDNNCNDTFTEAFIQSSAKQADTVTDILTKYSQIMRDSNNIQGSISTSGEMRNNTNHSSSKNVTSTNRNTTVHTEKKASKRPYKISDIHDLHISLPKSLVGDGKATAEAMVSHADIISRVKKIEPENNEIKTLTPLPNLETSFQAENVHEDFHIILSPEQLSPPDTSDMPLNEIDQTLLNPKTLLQCYSTEENLLLPPPPEFSDNIISYSPTGDLYNPVSCLDVDDMEEVLPWTNTDNFENSSRNTTLTPSKEIETWTLSVEDDTPTRERFYSKPFKSCTVMRNISSGIQNDANSIYGRPNLKSFKYKSKNKLKM